MYPDDHKFSNYITSGDTWSNLDLTIKKKDHMLQITIKKISIEIPIEKFSKFNKAESGTISYQGNKFTIPKMLVRDCGRVCITIKNAKGKVVESEPLWFCHYNTSVWFGLKNFLTNKSELCVIASDKTGNINLCISDEIYVNRNNSDYYHSTNNQLLSSDFHGIKTIKDNIKEYLSNTNKLIIIDSKDTLNKIQVKIPKSQSFIMDQELKLNWQKRYDSIPEGLNHKMIQRSIQRAADIGSLYSRLNVLKNIDLNTALKRFHSGDCF